MKFSVIFHDFTQSSVEMIFNTYGMPESSVEIGAFEGYTAFNLTSWCTRSNPNYKHYVIDPYGNSDDLQLSVVTDAHQQFVENLNEFEYRNNMEFINDTSWNGLMELHRRNIKVDFIYVDGDHREETVLEDLVLGFQLLKTNGVMLCDDCVAWKHQDDRGYPALQRSPKLAVDNFIQCNWSRLEMVQLSNGYQQAFRKTC